MMRFLRALIQALRMTLRGESIAPAHYRPLEGWINEALRLLARVNGIAREGSQDLDEVVLKLDGRPTSLDRSLRMLRHNLVNEYPRLMRLDDPYSMMVVQSSNLNDQYRLSQFVASDMVASPELQAALAALVAHSERLPQVERPPG